MTRAQAARLLREAQTRDGERDLRSFVRQGWPILHPEQPFVPNWHLDAIADHLMAVTAGEIRKLLINIPPRMGKSQTASVFWVPWTWTKRADWQFICASFDLGLSLKLSVRCRRVIQSPWYQSRWGHVFRLTTDQNVKSLFENDRTGRRSAVSFKATPTGDGGNVVLADDPINIADAENLRALEHAIEMWDRVFSTRLNDPETGARVIVMQRLNERDLSGRILESGGYVHLCLPQEFDRRRICVTVGSVRPHVADDGTVTYRPQSFRDPREQEGELLFPARMGEEENAQLKAQLGGYAWGGQYNQNPEPRRGNILPREFWRYWTILPVRPDGQLDLDELWQSWDCSFKNLDSSDYVVGQVWGRKAAAFYLLDQIREHLDVTGTCAAIESLTQRWPRAFQKLVEDKANGPAVLSILKKKVPGLKAVNPEGGKVARARAVAPFHAAGNVWLPHATEARLPRLVDHSTEHSEPLPHEDSSPYRVHDAETDSPERHVVYEPYPCPWVSGFVEEAARFPRGGHDDQVDGFTQAILAVAVRAEPGLR